VYLSDDSVIKWVQERVKQLMNLDELIVKE
jgi:hypothetical protein